MNPVVCRFCGRADGRTVLDLGSQPPCDRFPLAGEAGPEQTHPLRMWWCAACGLAQLAEDGPSADEPRATEPLALTRQARAAVEAAATAGLLPAEATFVEHGSPHGGSWSALLEERGMRPARPDEPVDVVLDCFGLMHESDQAGALASRVDELADDGVLLVQYHPLTTIVEHGQWNALRHGHFAYYTTTSLAGMLRTVGLEPRTAWSFDLYGGTVLLAAGRARPGSQAPDHRVRTLLAAETETGADDPDVLARLQDDVQRTATQLHEWLRRSAARGRLTLGYGAASRAVALLTVAGIGPDLLPGIADASPAKQGRRMPGSGIPIHTPHEALAARPDELMLFLPDITDEVRAALPEFEDAGGQWVIAEPEPRTLPPVPARHDDRPARTGPGFVRHTPAPVTIGLPVRNGEPYLARALKSLLDQSCPDFALLIGDNGSTDATEEICRETTRADERVRYLRHPRDLGVVANHNVLVQRSPSPLFGWAAADDEYHPDRLRRLVEALDDRPGAVLAFSAAQHIDGDGRTLARWANECRVQDPDPVTRLYDLVTMPHSALHAYGLVRRDTLLRAGPMPPVGTGDRILLAALSLHGPFAQVDEDLLWHRQHPDQLSERTSGHEYLRAQRGGGIVLPNVEEGRWYLRAALRAPLPARDRARAVWALRRWLRGNAAPMARNVGRAAVDGGRQLLQARHSKTSQGR